jgi:hypothetical protein
MAMAVIRQALAIALSFVCFLHFIGEATAQVRFMRPHKYILVDTPFNRKH